MYSQLRLAALANKRVETEIDLLTKTDHQMVQQLQKRLAYIDEQIETCKENVLPEMLATGSSVVESMMEQASKLEGDGE